MKAQGQPLQIVTFEFICLFDLILLNYLFLEQLLMHVYICQFSAHICTICNVDLPYHIPLGKIHPLVM